MNGDGFGRDDWPDDQPVPGEPGESSPTEPSTHDQHLPGSQEHDPRAGEIADGADDDAADDSTLSDRAGTDAGADFAVPGEPVGHDHDFEPQDDVDRFDADAEADADTDHIDGTPTPSGSDDRWAAAIGYGGVDPNGAQPGLFDHLDLSGAGGTQDVEPEWLTAELAEARATWVDPSLFGASGPSESTSLGQASGADAVAGLWARLAPATPMPADTADALDALAARAGATPLRQVVEAARRLLDE